MAKGRDTRLARAAARAMELLDLVKASDDEVHGGKPIKGQTIVRSFTRQFFDSMIGEVAELSEDDILGRGHHRGARGARAAVAPDRRARISRRISTGPGPGPGPVGAPRRQPEASPSSCAGAP